jgi:glycerophosphoryl diester phosphodiesterase
MLLIGHRGCPTYEPENTLRSFARALELGADMLEFDVFALPSGEVVVFHDRYLQRTTDGEGLLLHHSFRELRKLDAGLGEKIPTLQEVLDLVDRQVPVVVELKNRDSAEPVARILDEYIQMRGWRAKDFIVSSFFHAEVNDFKNKCMPGVRIVVPTGVLPIDLAAYADDFDAYGITPDIEYVDQAFVDDAHRRGLKVFVFTIDSYEDTQLMVRLGVDGIFTNAPDVSRAALNAKLEAGFKQ